MTVRGWGAARDPRAWVGLAVGVGLLLVASADSAAPDSSVTQTSFSRWTKTVAKAQNLELCRYGSFQYHPAESMGFFALLERKASQKRQFILLVTTGGAPRAFLTKPELVTPMECGGPGPRKWEAGRTVRLGPWGHRPRQFQTLALVGQELVLVGESEDDPEFSSAIDWDELREGMTSNEEGAESFQRAIILVADPKAPWQSRLPPTANWVTFGQAAHAGVEDAQLGVRAELRDKTLRLELSARDDLARPLAAANAPSAAFLKADHFELWFCVPSAAECQKRTTRQLGIARLPDGQPHTRWLHPRRNREPLPPVSVEGDKVIVSLPLHRFAHDDGGVGLELEGKLSVAYSDCDQSAKGQESLVATSRLRWGDPESFGRLVRLQDGARFPTFDGGLMFDEDEDFPAKLPPAPW